MKHIASFKLKFSTQNSIKDKELQQCWLQLQRLYNGQGFNLHDLKGMTKTSITAVMFLYQDHSWTKNSHLFSYSQVQIL